MEQLLIKNGLVIDPKNKREEIADVLIVDGAIAKVAKGVSADKADIVDATGKIVAPGFIDMHVHAREPGREDKETIATASRAAARGGFTTCVMMPNTKPVADDQTVIGYMVQKASQEAVVNMLPTGAITKGLNTNELTQVRDLKAAGAIALTNDGLPVTDAGVMRMALQYASMFAMPILSHSENMSLSKGGCMHEGRVSTRLGLPGIPASSEYVQVAQEILLAQELGTSIHFMHMSSEHSLELIRWAKSKKIAITCETGPHYFSLTDEAVGEYNANAKMNPPLKAESDVLAVIRALKDGTIDCIATDHAPHTEMEKNREFEDCENGIIGLETAVGLMFDKLYHAKKLSISELIAKVTMNPARILRLEHKGHLSKGADADITIIDPNKTEIVDKHVFESKGRNTPFHGMKLKGVPSMTIVGGMIVMEDREVVV